jgi:hypothetical protein
MNVKTMAALVGTLSLASLATGCATAKPATATASAEKGGDSSCKGDAAAMKADTGATATQEKGGEHGCGAAGCGASKPQ